MTTTDPAVLLAAYDDQLRTDAETWGARSIVPLGPLRLTLFPGGRGFITYRDLGEVDSDGVRALVSQATAHYASDPDVVHVEWKTRGHDRAPGLHEALLDHGYEPGEEESIMIGEAALLAVDAPVPDGVSLRQVHDEAGLRAAVAMQDAVFGESLPAEMVDLMVERLAREDDVMELWVAEADGVVVCAGRLEPVAGTDFAGIWGGATLESWRGRGVYRALTAARARSALRLGKRFLNSDSTEFSRPILERSGLVKVSTTTPYTWSRPAG